MSLEFKGLSVADLKGLLLNHGISEEVIHNFEREEIDGDALPLTHDELKTVAPKIGQRKQLIRMFPDILLNVESEVAKIPSSSSTDTATNCSASSTCSVSTDDESTPEAQNTNEGSISYPCKLPTFSKMVKQALDKNQPYSEWDQLIREAAMFYLPEIPQNDGKARIAYSHIGRTMHEQYPSIKSTGQYPWSHFNKCLSSKIRWERRKRLASGQPKHASKQIKVFCTPSQSAPNSEPLSQTQLKSHIEEIQKKSNTSDKSHIVQLLRETFPNRRQSVLEKDNLMSPSELVNKLYSDYPVFGEEKYLLVEFDFVEPGISEKYNKNYEELVPLMARYHEVTVKREYDSLEVFKLCEVVLSRSSKHSLITVMQVSQAKDLKPQVDESSAPKIVAVVDGHGGELTCAFVLAYGKQRMEISGKNIVQRALFAVLALYFISDLSYPKVNRVFLKFLQSGLLDIQLTEKEIPRSLKTYLTKVKNVL